MITVVTMVFLAAAPAHATPGDGRLLCLQQPGGSSSNVNTEACLRALSCLSQGLTVVEDTGFSKESGYYPYGRIKFLPVRVADDSNQACVDWVWGYGRWRPGLPCFQSFMHVHSTCLKAARLMTHGDQVGLRAGVQGSMAAPFTPSPHSTTHPLSMIFALIRATAHGPCCPAAIASS
jgi:hypothetical protein